MTPPPVSPDPKTVGLQPKPSRARYVVVFFAVTLAIITYIDRVCISQAAPNISAELNLSKEQMSYAFAAFAWAYALFEIPGGWLGDWIGPRKVLMRVVVMWSFFTAATGWAINLVSLVIVRFLFGAGEAGCFPNVTKAFSIWLPKDQQVRAQGILWLSARWGGAFTPLLVVWVLGFMTWRQAFMLFGAIGVIWAIFFYRWFADDPRKHPSVNAGELALLATAQQNATGHSKIPWGKFVRSRTVWLLWIQYFCLAYPWYFYITWLPTYLQEARGVSLQKSAVLSGLPLFFGGLGSLFCGMMSARIARSIGSTAKTRRLMAYVGFTAAGLMLLWFLKIQDPTYAMIAMGLASFANDLVMPGSWGACMDVGGKYAGTLSGSMNMMGNFAGGIAPIVTALVLKSTNNNWNIPIIIMAAIYFAGAFCWILIDPVTPLEPETTEENLQREPP